MVNWSKKDVKKAVADIVSDETVRVMDELRREEQRKARAEKERQQILEASRVSLVKKPKELEVEPKPIIPPIEDTFYCLIEGNATNWVLTIKSDDERTLKQVRDGYNYVGEYHMSPSYKTVSCLPDWGIIRKEVPEDKNIAWVRNEAAKFLAVYLRSYHRCHTSERLDQTNPRVQEALQYYSKNGYIVQK